ncbi:MAG: PAS domain S-box protein [Gammaproteobacteria bacterium]|nr:PAS domain S-box protein [Gammaproteobacteria bacterium]
MNQKLRVFLFILVVTAVTASVGGITLFKLYQITLEQHRRHLRQAVRSYAYNVTNLMAQPDIRLYVEHAPDRSLPSRLKDACEHIFGIRETTEIVLGKREKEQIIFLPGCRDSDVSPLRPVPFSEAAPQPMQRALSKKSGTFTGLDCYGNRVLAAYQPAEDLGIGIVAKTGLAELQAPFYKVAWLSGGSGAALIFFGTLVFLRITAPLLRRCEENEKKYRAIVDTAAEGIITINEKGIVNSFNKAAEKMFGYSEDEIIAENINKLMPEPYRGEHDGHLKNYLISRRKKVIDTTSQVTARHKDGRLFPIELAVSEANLEDSLLFTGILQDITERKRAEQREAGYARIIDDSLSEIYVFDTTSLNFIQVNRGARKNLGYSMDELQELTIFDLEPEISFEHFTRLVFPLRTNEQNKVQYTTLHRRKDGTVYPVDVAIQLSVLESLPVFIAIMLNISKRKRIEAELARERRNLEKTVELRTAELRETLKKVEDANLRLEQANRHKSRFLSSMSHELRTPLNGILGFTDLLNRQFFGSLNEKQQSYVHQINSSGKHLLTLINDLLDMAKIDAGAMYVELKEVAPDECANATAAMMSGQFKKKNIKIKTEIDPALTVITVDIRKYKQIMLNLLSNAAKYTPEGGQVKVRVMKEGGMHVRTEIADTGIGIEPAELDNIFSEFYQADQVRDEKLGGTGIGLSLTRRLVELHNGEIGVESELGAGSTFWFTLPIKKLSSAESAQKPKKPEPKDFVRARRILVAEDNEVNLAMILDMLSIHNHKIIVARNGKEVLDLAELHNPELFLMDIRMPIMTGLEATLRLRSMPKFAKTPIIALTASTGSEAEERQITAGCTEHLAKPIRSRELFAVLQRHLDDNC